MVGTDVASRRKAYIAVALRRARPGAGSRLDILRAQTSYSVMDLRQIITQTEFVVVGGVATHLYMPERATLDIDILVRARDAQRLSAELRNAGAARLGDLSIGGASWRLPDGTLLDTIESSAPWVDAALAHSRAGPDGLPYVALPFLVVMKLQAGRVQDIADISRMLGVAGPPALAGVRRVVAAYAPDAVEDLESLIALGQLEAGGPPPG